MRTVGKGGEKKKKTGIKGFRILENECIWMKAGVVNFRICDNAYDCNNCTFDKGMRRAMKSGDSTNAKTKTPEWVERLKREYRGDSRPCRHTLTGRISAPKICTQNYECYHCPFDQMLDDADLMQLIAPSNYKLASGYKMVDGIYYHMGHSWMRFEHGGRVRVGFDDFMVRLFGALEFLRLPPLGVKLEQNQAGWIFGRDQKRAAVLSPVTGVVLAVNHKAHEHPEITHEDPYHEGWLLMVEPLFPKEDVKGLYYGNEGYKWMEQEARRLLSLMGPEYERLASTGGSPVGDVYGNFPEIGWDSLVWVFLRTEKVQKQNDPRQNL